MPLPKELQLIRDLEELHGIQIEVRFPRQGGGTEIAVRAFTGRTWKKVKSLVNNAAAQTFSNDADYPIKIVKA